MTRSLASSDGPAEEPAPGVPPHPFFLSSLESARFSGLFRCDLASRVALSTGRHGLRVTVSPAARGQDLGFPQGLSELVLFNRFEGDDLWQLDDYPVFVSICIASDPGATLREVPEVIAWGEVYPSAEDARSHTMRGGGVSS
ncbi:MAG: hypothetical protein PIR02_06245 [Microbacterium enclense]